jgi:hypothetical protein
VEAAQVEHGMGAVGLPDDEAGQQHTAAGLRRSEFPDQAGQRDIEDSVIDTDHKDCKHQHRQRLPAPIVGLTGCATPSHLSRGPARQDRTLRDRAGSANTGTDCTGATGRPKRARDVVPAEEQEQRS